MTPEVLTLFVAALLAVPLSWAVPERLAGDAVALWTLLVLAFLAPVSATWLVGSAAGTVGVMRLGERLGRPDLAVAGWTAVLVGALLIGRDMHGWALIGAAYFTLRNLHVLFDVWMGRLANPSLRQMLRYQLFLPVIAVGPIHRFQNFERQSSRRRFEPSDLGSGAERVLFGMAQALVLGGFVMNAIERAWLRLHPSGFALDWLLSAIAWERLYFTFAGFSSVAIGITLMMGLRIEENFNHPYLARNLVDFWLRWHMTLSFWCRDYVFQPVTALTRNPIAGVVAGMLAIGLWHETSAYYVLWAFWQALGIVLSRFASRAAKLWGWRLPGPVRVIAAPLTILAWLSLAKPVLTRLLEGFA